MVVIKQNLIWIPQQNGMLNITVGDANAVIAATFLKLASQKKLPKYIIETLDELGILPDKATYVCELFTDDAGIHYQFSYRIAGIITHIPNTYDGENCNDVRCCHESYPYGAPNFPEPHFDLEFYATLP